MTRNGSLRVGLRLVKVGEKTVKNCQKRSKSTNLLDMPECKTQSAHPAVSSMTTPTTMGSGFNGGSCDSAHLIITEVLARAMKLNVCGFAIFADLKRAFASLHRNISMADDDDGDLIWHEHLHRCGFSPEQVLGIINLACDILKWSEHGGSEFTFAMLKDAHLGPGSPLKDSEVVWPTTPG